MKFRDFEEKYTNYPIISDSIFLQEYNIKYLRILITKWVKKKWLIRLKKGFYVINKDYYLNKLNRYFIANNIYTPSYISLWSALSFYGIIPEGVYSITSVSSRKTALFKNFFGDFIYHNLKNELFFGYEIKVIDNLNVLWANPEKAFLDFLYLNIKNISINDDIRDNFRFQNLDKLRKTVIKKYLKVFNNKKLDIIVNKLIDVREGYRVIL